jgi:hypothetical protein
VSNVIGAGIGRYFWVNSRAKLRYLRHVASQKQPCHHCVLTAEVQESDDHTASSDKWQCVEAGFEGSVERPLEKNR